MGHTIDFLNIHIYDPVDRLEDRPKNARNDLILIGYWYLLLCVCIEILSSKNSVYFSFSFFLMILRTTPLEVGSGQRTNSVVIPSGSICFS